MNTINIGKKWTKTSTSSIRLIHRSKPRESEDMMMTITSLCQQRRLKEALQALYSNPAPSSSSTGALYSYLLQLCIDSSAKEEGISLRNHILAIGHSPNLCLDTKFIIFYSKVAGDLVAARKVFDEMPQRSIVSWTAMISAYSQNGDPKVALKLFASMRHSGFSANQFTYGATLGACTRMDAIRVGEQVQGLIEKSRFAGDLFVQSALVDLHMNCGLVENARSLFQRMERRDVVSWNSVIGGYANRGLGDDAFVLFRSMMRDGLLPDQFTFVNVLRACSPTRALCSLNQIHAFIIKLGYGNHHLVTGSLVDAYAKCRRMQSAKLVYDSMLKHDLISCTSLINGYISERNSKGEALDLFCEIHRMGMPFDDFILCSLLSLCADVASLSLGRQIHACALKNRPIVDVALGNALIDMYAKTGELEDAHQAFDEMQHKNVISWTSLITSYGKHGNGEGAVALFSKMEDVGVKPNDVTFLSLLFACSHSGLTTKGMDFFNSMMSKYGIHPRAEHYSCVVDLLARGGLLKEAYDLACNMDVKPNISLWGSLLGACSLHGNTSLGRIAAAHLFDLDPERSVNYVVLANIYASVGLWEDARKLRKLTEGRSVKKIAGCSFI